MIIEVHNKGKLKKTDTLILNAKYMLFLYVLKHLMGMDFQPFFHYENMPIQICWIFYHQKMKKFR